MKFTAPFKWSLAAKTDASENPEDQKVFDAEEKAFFDNTSGDKRFPQKHEQPSSINEQRSPLTSAQKFRVLERCGHESFDVESNDNEFPPEVEFFIDKIETLTIRESLDNLKEVLAGHIDDVNFPVEDYERIERLVSEAELFFESGNEEDIVHIVSTGAVVGDVLSQTSIKKSGTLDEKTAGDEIAAFEKEEAVAINIDWTFELKLECALVAFHSPYPEIRALTDPFDDPEIPVETFRAYFLGFLWTIIGAGVNEFFYHRQPAITLTSSIIQLFLYPCGTLWGKFVPLSWCFHYKNKRYGLNIATPWSFKEQMFATIIYSVSATNAYVDSNIYVQKLKLFYGNEWADFGYQLLLILSTQCLGFGFAGIMRKICVYPTRAVWPTMLPTLALNRALLKKEKKESINGWTISRYSFFLISFAGSFLYFWLPDYLFSALSTFNWLTWIKPDNFNLAAITGSSYGLGLNPIPSFDWNVIDFNYCLTIPFYSQVNQYIGSIIAFFTIIGVYWSNKKWTGYLPINSNGLFTNTGDTYSVSEILTNNLFDQEKYDKYGPPFYTAANMVVYGAFFAIYPFSIVYTVYNEFTSMKFSVLEIYKSFKDWKRSNFANFKDPHSKMMSKYKEVPDWIFLCVLVCSIVLAILCVKVYPAQTPVWGIFFAIGINFVFLIPITAIYSVTGFSFGLNVLVELIVGYAIPGNGLALMTIKAFGYNIDGQAQNYISDQKIAHYAKIPPRAIFRGQLISTILSSFVTLGVLNWEIVNVKNICTIDQSQKFSCPQERTFYSASVLWGVIGPKKVFNGLYPILKYCFLIGALLPIPCILFKKYGPKYLTRTFQPTLIIGGMLIFAPYNLTYYTGGLYVSFIFMHYIRKHYLSWWEKYNYILTAAMTAGVAFSAIIIFFAVQYHEKDLNWWGNEVSYKGVEGGAGRQTYLDPTLLPDGYFGPRIGHFP